MTTFNDQLQVFYDDASASSVRHAWWTGRTWHFETLDGIGGVYAGHTSDHLGSYQQAATTYSGQLEVFYWDDTADALRHAWWG